MSIIKIQDFLHKEYQLHLQKVVENELPIGMQLDTVVYSEEHKTAIKIDSNTLNVPQFGVTFVRNNEPVSPYFELIRPITYALLAVNGVGANQKLIRCKLNINPIQPECDANKYFAPHIDAYEEDRMSGIYYVNNSDGDTLFFDNDGNIVDRVTPKQGLFVYFKSNTFHAGQPPKTSHYRSVINFVWGS
jgi:hypothetical protein